MIGRWSVIFTHNAEKELIKLPKDISLKIRDVIFTEITLDPFSGDIKRLQGDKDKKYRRRVGNYRIIYKVYKTIITVEIVEIVHRKDAYK